MKFKEYFEKKTDEEISVTEEEENWLVKVDGDTGEVEELGVMDNDTERAVRNELKKEQFTALAKDMMKQNNYPVRLFKFIVPLFLKYFCGRTEDIVRLRHLMFENPIEMPYQDETPYELANIEDYYARYLPPQFFKEIYEWQPKIRGYGVGIAEMIIGLFTQIKNSTGAGDLEVDGKSIEMKGIGGRLKGPHTDVKNGMEAKEEIIDILRDIRDAHFDGEEDEEIRDEVTENIDELGNASKWIGKTFLGRLKSTLRHLVENGINILDDQSTINSIVSALTNYRNVRPTNKHRELFKDAVMGDEKDWFYAVCLAFHIYAYKNAEDMSYLMVANEEGTKVVSHDTGQDLEHDAEFAMEYIAKFDVWNNMNGYGIIGRF